MSFHFTLIAGLVRALLYNGIDTPLPRCKCVIPAPQNWPHWLSAVLLYPSLHDHEHAFDDALLVYELFDGLFVHDEHAAVPPALYLPVAHTVHAGLVVLLPDAPYFALQFTLNVHAGYAEPL